MRLLAFPLLVLGACGGTQGTAVAPDLAVDKASMCASTFGQSLTNAFGRMDGTVLAVVPPTLLTCAQPNSTHLVIQVLAGGAAYRMVVDVLSNQGSPDVLYDEVDAPLVGDAWAEGWHPGASLDYPTNLGASSTAFTATKEADLVAAITSQIELGARISVFATSADRPDSAHLVHRHLTNAPPDTDGAIVIHPDTAPHWLLMHFDEQVF